MRSSKLFRVLQSPVWMVAIAFAVRFLLMVFLQTYRLSIKEWTIFEMAQLARSLAEGHGFASPWGGDTGPSAWTAPLYPFIVSLAFRVFGVFSPGAAFAMFVFNSIFSALTCWTIYRIARRVFGETVGLWSGWLWTIFPVSIFFSIYWIWETTLSAFLLSLLFLMTLEMEDDGRTWSWVRYGGLWAVAALTNTSVVAWLPFSGCWLCYQLYRRGKKFLVPALISAVVFWGILTPWLIRDYSKFNKFIFVRGDLGVELRVGNNPQAEGWWVTAYHPGNNPQLYREYRSIGEAAFDTESADAALEWISYNRGRFVVLTLRRVLFYWIGIPKSGVQAVQNVLFAAFSLLSIAGLIWALRRRVFGWFLFLTLIVSIPVIYYVGFPSPRYRHAIEPELMPLAVFVLASVFSGRGKKHAEAQEGKPLEDNEKALSLVGVLVKAAAAVVGLLVLLIAFALWYNNYSLRHSSRAEFNRQLDARLDKAITWIAANPRSSVSNPPLLYMAADMAKLSGDPRLRNVLQQNLATLSTEYRSQLLTPYWQRFIEPGTPLPFVTTTELYMQMHDQRWFAYAIDPQKAHVSDDDLADLRSPDKYVWGARHHQVLALIMYKNFQGLPPDMAKLLRTLSEKEARDQTADFRVTDAYEQRVAFILAAGHPDLIRSRWIERIMENQNPDGSWNVSWYGWSRGIFEFGVVDPGHATIQAAWALAQIKYRYPQWIEQHYQ